MNKYRFTFSTRLHNRRSIVNQLRKYCEYENHSLLLLDDHGFFERIHSATVTCSPSFRDTASDELEFWLQSINGSELEEIE